MQTKLRIIFVTCTLALAVQDVAAVWGNWTDEEKTHLPRRFTTALAWVTLETIFRVYRSREEPGFVTERTAYDLALYSSELVHVSQAILEELRLRDLGCARDNIPDRSTVDSPPPEDCSDTDEVYFLRDHSTKCTKTE